jgi:hypothetical protein
LHDAIWAALIAAAASVISNIILSRKQAAEMNHKMEIRQAVTDTKIEELTREVREHNNFARRTPVLEQEMTDVKAMVKTLQGYHMN